MAYPTFYDAIDDNLNECILLEDLRIRDFYMTNLRNDKITADHVNLVMQSLAKLHAISFAIKDQLPETFANLQSNLKTVFSKDSADQRELLKKRSNLLMKIVSEEKYSHLLVRLKELFKKDAADIAIDCLDPTYIGSATVISHGDAWQNNFMFRYDEQGIPIEVILLDWQLSQCASPAFDVSYFIFCSTTKRIRDAHYNDFLKIYHNNLSKHIQK